jgi:hypothetical protein
MVRLMVQVSKVGNGDDDRCSNGGLPSKRGRDAISAGVIRVVPLKKSEARSKSGLAYVTSAKRVCTLSPKGA